MPATILGNMTMCCLFQLLIEWGCDMHCQNSKKQTPLESVKNDEFRNYLVGELAAHRVEPGLQPVYSNSCLEELQCEVEHDGS